MTIVPQIKETRKTRPEADREIVYALKNEKMTTPGTVKLHKYRGLKIAFAVSILWFLIFDFVIMLFPVVPTRGHRVLGMAMIIFVLVNFFVVEAFFGGGKSSNRSGVIGSWWNT